MKPVLWLLPALTLTAALIGSLFLGCARVDAQAPPPIPHTFFGDRATLDGAVVVVGTLVVALDEDSRIIASTTGQNSNFVLRIDSEQHQRIRFTIGNAVPTGLFNVAAGSLTEVNLDLTTLSGGDTDPAEVDPTPPAEDDAETDGGISADTGPGTLPSAGNGGLSGVDDDAIRGTLLLVFAVFVALSAVVGVRFTRAHD